MTITVTADQEECFGTMRLLGIRPENIQPQAPGLITDAIMELDPSTWFLITNRHGLFMIYLLEETNKKEAWDFFENLKPAGVKAINPRVVLPDPDKTPARN